MRRPLGLIALFLLLVWRCHRLLDRPPASFRPCHLLRLVFGTCDRPVGAMLAGPCASQTRQFCFSWAIRAGRVRAFRLLISLRMPTSIIPVQGQGRGRPVCALKHPGSFRLKLKDFCIRSPFRFHLRRAALGIVHAQSPELLERRRDWL